MTARWVCEGCVPDAALRAATCTSSPGVPCDFCGQHSDAQADVDELFAYVHDCLLGEYDDPNESHLLWDQEEGEWVGVSVLETRDVLTQLDDPLGDGRLAELFVNDVDHDWYELDSEVGTIDQRQLWSWDSFEQRLRAGPRFLFSRTDAVQGEVSSDEFFAFLGTLAAQLQTQFVKRTAPGIVLFRARCASGRHFTSAEDLGSPSIAQAVPQRMSAAGVACFYAAEDPTTAHLEIRPEPAKIVSIGKWAVHGPLVYADFVQELSMPSIFDPVGARNRPFIRFLRDFVTRISRPKDVTIGDANSYLATQVLSEFLRYALPTPWKVGVDAVRFPSSIHPDGVNWVVFGRPDRGPTPKLTLVGADNLTLVGADNLTLVGADRCQATLLMRDDRWGGFVDRCDLTAVHEGEHRTARDACEPPAWLCWTGTYERPTPPPVDRGEETS